jgi:hypothetical protein
MLFNDIQDVFIISLYVSFVDSASCNTSNQILFTCSQLKVLYIVSIAIIIFVAVSKVCVDMNSSMDIGAKSIDGLFI